MLFRSHAKSAIQNGLHIVMIDVEADVQAGAQLAREAKAAGVVYSMAYGDQPALTCELVDWAHSTGFDVVAAERAQNTCPVITLLPLKLSGIITG